MPYKLKENQKQYLADWYQKNQSVTAERTKASKKRAQQRAREYTDNLKAATACSNCGHHFDPVCMDFHHVGEKTGKIARMVNQGNSLDRIKAEIEKCVVLCANCHRLHHALARGTGPEPSKLGG